MTSFVDIVVLVAQERNKVNIFFYLNFVVSATKGEETLKCRCLSVSVRKSLKAHRQISKKRCFEKYCSCDKACFFFYLGFLSRTFTNHRTAREGGGHFFSSSLPESSPLHIASCRTRTGTFGFQAQVANHQVTRP